MSNYKIVSTKSEPRVELKDALNSSAVSFPSTSFPQTRACRSCIRTSKTRSFIWC